MHFPLLPILGGRTRCLIAAPLPGLLRLLLRLVDWPCLLHVLQPLHLLSPAASITFLNLRKTRRVIHSIWTTNLMLVNFQPGALTSVTTFCKRRSFRV